jgi:hypothetical protein
MIHVSTSPTLVALLDQPLLLLLLPFPCCITCSCPGIAVYLTVFCFTSVAVPMYLSHLVDQAARRRYRRTVTADLAAAAATAAADQPAQQQQQLGQSSAAAAAGVVPVLTHHHQP